MVGDVVVPSGEFEQALIHRVTQMVLMWQLIEDGWMFTSYTEKAVTTDGESDRRVFRAISPGAASVLHEDDLATLVDQADQAAERLARRRRVKDWPGHPDGYSHRDEHTTSDGGGGIRDEP